MTLANQKTILTVLGACAIAAGCSVLSPQPDRSRFYILTPVPEGSGLAVSSAATAPNSQLTIGVGPVEFPDYLRRLPVVTRVGPNRIEMSDERRWAEPLDKNFTRVLSENLATLLATQRIEKYPWPLATKIDYQIEVDVQRFETISDGQSQLIARWIVRDGHTGETLYASQTTTSASVTPGDTGESAALSNDLATLSKEIASRIAGLSGHRNPAEANAAAADDRIRTHKGDEPQSDGGKYETAVTPLL